MFSKNMLYVNTFQTEKEVERANKTIEDIFQLFHIEKYTYLQASHILEELENELENRVTF